jgi:hypothetical protein
MKWTRAIRVEKMRWKKRLDEISRLKKKYQGNRWTAPFPDLKVERGPPSLGDGFAPVGGLRELPVDAKQFPVGLNHKQGTELLTPAMIANDLQWLGGRKT